MKGKVEGWKVVEFGDVCNFIRGPFGGSLKKEIFVQDGFAVYEQQHAIYNQFEDIRYFINTEKFDEMKRFEVTPGNLIMSCSGTMGKVAIVPSNVKKGIINQALLLIKPTDKILNTFIKYWMESDGFQKGLQAFSQGAAIQNVASVKVLKEIEIPIPPLPEQQRIVSLLDQAFAALAQVHANAERNLVNAREVFESKLRLLVQDKKWKEKKLQEVCAEIFAGGDVPKDRLSKVETPEFSIPIYSNGEKDKGLYGYTDVARVTLPSITVSARGTIGYSEIRNNPFYPAIRLIVATPNLSLIHLSFLQYAIRSIDFKHSGVSIPQLTVPMIKDYLVPLPPLEEQHAIVERLDTLAGETQRLEAIYQSKLEAVEELRKSMLRKAFAGEL